MSACGGTGTSRCSLTNVTCRGPSGWQVQPVVLVPAVPWQVQHVRARGTQPLLQGLDTVMLATDHQHRLQARLALHNMRRCKSRRNCRQHCDGRCVLRKCAYLLNHLPVGRLRCIQRRTLWLGRLYQPCGEWLACLETIEAVQSERQIHPKQLTSVCWRQRLLACKRTTVGASGLNNTHTVYSLHISGCMCQCTASVHLQLQC